jgi:hypothetical protein
MHGLYLMWWVQEKHVPAATVAVLLAAGDLAITALEIPTGWLADRYGHRASLLAGSVAQIVGMLLAWLGEGPLGLLAAVLVIAVGDAFRSGADQALLYRSFVALDRESDFQRIESRSHGLQLVALVVMILTGGAIVRWWGFAAGWMAETVVSTIGLAIAWAMIEPPAAVESSDASDNAGIADAAEGIDAARDRQQPAVRHQSSAMTDITATAIATRPALTTLRPLAWLIAPAALVHAASSGTAFLAQTAGGSEATRMTMLVAVITLAEAMGAGLAARLPAQRSSQLILAAIGTLVTIAAFAVPVLFMPGVVVLSLLTGIVEPLRAASIQRLAADHVRARAASIASAFDRALVTIALVWAGRASKERHR